MKPTFPRARAVLTVCAALSFFTTAAFADASAQDAAEVADAAAETPNPQPMPAEPAVGDATTPAEIPSESPQAEASAQEEELICRSIRLDMSSRRKTRVCRTEEGWRQLNQQR